MTRYFVCRAYFKWKGKMYHKGDLLPENFTHHDKARSIYNSRVAVCEVREEESISDIPATETVKPLSGEKPETAQLAFDLIPDVGIAAVFDEVADINKALSLDELSGKEAKPDFSLLQTFFPGTP